MDFLTSRAADMAVGLAGGRADGPILPGAALRRRAPRLRVRLHGRTGLDAGTRCAATGGASAGGQRAPVVERREQHPPGHADRTAERGEELALERVDAVELVEHEGVGPGRVAGAGDAPAPDEVGDRPGEPAV